MINKKIFLLLILLVVYVFLPKHSFALTISPVRYELRGDPGETLVKEMTLINEGHFPSTLYSSFANFEASGESGSATFVEPKDDIGTWINTNESVSLKPGEETTIPFTIKIPKNAESGGHYGVIFWGTSPSKEKGKQVSVSSRTGALILLSVNGEVKEGGGLLSFKTLDDIFWYNSLPVSFVYRFRNDGNDRIKPKGYLKIRNSLFIRTKKMNANPVDGNILPKSTRKFTLTWVENPRSDDYVSSNNFIKKYFDDALYQWKNFALGLYSAKLDLNYGLNNQNNAKDVVYFFVFPWQLTLLLIIVLIAIFFVGKKLLKKYNNYVIKKAQLAGKL